VTREKVVQIKKIKLQVKSKAKENVPEMARSRALIKAVIKHQKEI